MFSKLIHKLIRPRGKVSFLAQLDPMSKILDVGCGNNSPSLVKKILPKCEYTGIDVGDYNQNSSNFADYYILTTPDYFHHAIKELPSNFDAVISAHNIEHCEQRMETLQSMLDVMNRGSMLYISFQSEKTTSFPSRVGTLNYYDDPTHKDVPPNYDLLVKKLQSSDCEIIFASKSYKPIILRAVGFINETLSFMTKRVRLGTWEYYGFETVIWAKKHK